jgi:RNA polymerase sigma factor (sigma-70 family)
MLPQHWAQNGLPVHHTGTGRKHEPMANEPVSTCTPLVRLWNQDVNTDHEHANAPEPKVVNVAASMLTDAVEHQARTVPVSLDAFLANIERRAWRMARMALGDPEEAHDAVQDAMLRLVRSYRSKPAEEWTPLFWGILRRRITDLQRRRKVRSIMVGWIGGGRDADGDELPAWEAPDNGPGPQHRLADQQSWAAVSEAVQTLPQRQREAFMLRTLEQLSVAETAAAMGCSEGSVKTHLSRALSSLRDQLEGWR